MERFYKYSLAMLITLVAVIEFIQVMLRYVFQHPVFGLEEILLYPTLWMYFLGSVNGSREDTQIKANVLDIFLKTKKSVLILQFISNLFSIVICAWLTWWGWDYFRYSWRVWKDSPTLYIPTFYAECSMFIGLAAMTFYVGFHLRRTFRELVTAGNEG